MPDRVLSVPGTAAFSAFTGLAIRGNQVLISSQVGLPVLHPSVGPNCRITLLQVATSGLHACLQGPGPPMAWRHA